MDELIGQLADKAGIDGAWLEKTVGIIRTSCAARALPTTSRR